MRDFGTHGIHSKRRYVVPSADFILAKWDCTFSIYIAVSEYLTTHVSGYLSLSVVSNFPQGPNAHHRTRIHKRRIHLALTAFHPIPLCRHCRRFPQGLRSSSLSATPSSAPITTPRSTTRRTCCATAESARFPSAVRRTARITHARTATPRLRTLISSYALPPGLAAPSPSAAVSENRFLKNCTSFSPGSDLHKIIQFAVICVF